MALTLDIGKAHYDDFRKAVVVEATDGDEVVTCFVTAEALNDRANAAVGGEALLVIFARYQEEIGRLLGMMHKLGHYSAPGEIWLTTNEFYR